MDDSVAGCRDRTVAGTAGTITNDGKGVVSTDNPSLVMGWGHSPFGLGRRLQGSRQGWRSVQPGVAIRGI